MIIRLNIEQSILVDVFISFLLCGSHPESRSFGTTRTESLLIVSEFITRSLKLISVDLNKIKGFHVEFSDIHDRIEEIFTYLTGDKIDWVIYNIFKDLNITTMINMDAESAKALLNEAN